MIKDQDTGKKRETTPGEAGLRKWFNDFMDLRDGMDREGAMKSIQANPLMRGSNAWMLVCSIMIASLGLNLNSGAVIIGAMLISPLMNPILGVGLGVGTNDNGLLRTALENFAVAIVIALATSFIYFFFTPLDNFTSEMSARTEPTILDGLVAVFGGLAGIISVTRADKTNAIPGVAIATALMPPLCVAGYGLVVAVKTGASLGIFYRAFYLFFLNSFFIAATAYLIIRILRFPYKKYLNKSEARRSQLIIAVISMLMIAPGIYILRDVIAQDRISKAAAAFTEAYFPESLSTYLLDRNAPDSPRVIYPLMNRYLSPDSLRYYSSVLQQPPYNIAGAKIVIDTSYSPSEIAAIKGELAGIDDLNNRLHTLEVSQSRMDLERNRAEAELRTYRIDSTLFQQVTSEVRLAFPTVTDVHIARAQSSDGRFGPDDEPPYADRLPLVVVGTRNRRALPDADRERLREFFKLNLRADTLLLFVDR